MNSAAKLPLVDFDALEGAVRETARGRWFLDEFARRLRSAETDRVHQSIEKLATLMGDKGPSSSFDVLRRELESMAAGIAQTRREIAAIKPPQAGNGEASSTPVTPSHDRIVAATEELDFVVRSTETATAEILTTAERLQTLAGELKAKGGDAALCDEVENHATNLMIACSFQDLTGQRMTKVVNALRYIEQRVNSMIEIWGINPGDAKGVAPPVDNRPDAHLLNGPARQGEGVAQDEVDRMMNGEAAPAPVATPAVPAPVVAAAPAAPAPTPAPAPASAPPAAAAPMSSQNDIDALFG